MMIININLTVIYSIYNLLSNFIFKLMNYLIHFYILKILLHFF